MDWLKSARTDLETALGKYGYSLELARPIINQLYKKKTVYNDNVIYYGGHKVRLGHYFRHLFQTVKFVDRVTFLNTEQKREYVKMLRAQMSDYEQEIFFFNSLSIGREWLQEKYIDNYELTKNLPERIIGIDPDVYFPKSRGKR